MNNKVENTKVKITIPIPINKPDANGIIYTTEAVENAINNIDRYLPIVYKENAETDDGKTGRTAGKNTGNDFRRRCSESCDFR